MPALFFHWVKHGKNFQMEYVSAQDDKIVKLIETKGAWTIRVGSKVN